MARKKIKFMGKNEQGVEAPVFIEVLGNSLATYDGDVNTVIVDQYFRQHTAVTSTVATATAVNDYTIVLASATGFAAGDYIHINTGTEETTHPQIISIAVNTLTLDRRLDVAHSIGDVVTKAIIDMALTGQIGTLASPQLYVIKPPPGKVWHITRVLFSMVLSTAGDLGLFGNLAALTNGTVMRAKVSGTYGTLTNWKINADIKTDMFDVEFDGRSGGLGSFGMSGRGTFTETGATLKLDGDEGDQLEFYIQDDITTIAFFSMKAQGHLAL